MVLDTKLVVLRVQHARKYIMNEVSTPSRRSRLNGHAVGIPPRHIDFNFAPDTPRYFFANNATATLFFAMLSGFFPPGERYFMESVRHFRERITDERLRAAIAGFMGQEAIHGREHDLFNAMLAARGFDMETPDRIVKVALNLLGKLPPSTRLAATTFMEHFTALLAEQLLTDEAFQGKADAELITLWQWHALEELEHKSVAYDVYETIGNSQTERAVAVLSSLVVLVPMLGITWSWMVYKDGQFGRLKDNVTGLNLLFGRQGFVTRILPRLPEFLGKRFHPRQHDTQAIEHFWRDALFGDGGTLQTRYRNREAA